MKPKTEEKFDSYEATVTPPDPATLRQNRNAQVLFDLYSREQPYAPYPIDYRDIWDADHVKMPFSAKNLYPTKAPNGQSSIFTYSIYYCTDQQQKYKT